MRFSLNQKEIDKKNEIVVALDALFDDAAIEYRFIPTGIGTIVKIYAPKIDKLYDITDYDSW